MSIFCILKNLNCQKLVLTLLWLWRFKILCTSCTHNCPKTLWARSFFHNDEYNWLNYASWIPYYDFRCPTITLNLFPLYQLFWNLIIFDLETSMSFEAVYQTFLVWLVIQYLIHIKFIHYYFGFVRAIHMEIFIDIIYPKKGIFVVLTSY